MFNYRPPTELREGNVFYRVCLSFCLSMGGSHVTITYALDFTVHSLLPPPHPHIRRGTPPASGPGPGPTPLPLTSDGQHLRPVQTCSLEDDPTPNRHFLVATSMYGLQAGGTHPTGIPSCSLCDHHVGRQSSKCLFQWVCRFCSRSSN